MKYPVHFCIRCSVCINAVANYAVTCCRGCPMLHITTPHPPLLPPPPCPLLPHHGIHLFCKLYICEVPWAKCVIFCGRSHAQCISVEITSDGIARNFCSLFNTMVLYFGPMKVGKEKSDSRQLKTLHDVLGCFYPLSTTASFSTFHSSRFVNLLLSFQDCKKRPQKNHWSWQQPLEITLLAPQSFLSGSCHQQLPDQLSPAVVLAADH